MNALFLALCLLAAPEPIPEEPAGHGGGWRLRWLELDVVVDLDGDVLLVEGAATLELTELDASYGPSLGMNRDQATMSFVEVEAEGAEHVELNARHPRRPALRLAHVRYAEPFHRGDELELSFRCRSGGAEGSQFKLHPTIALAGWTDAWYPVAAPLPGESFHSRLGAAPGETFFDLPEGWSSVSSGRRIEREEHGTRVHERWEDEVAVARSFCAAKYHHSSHEVAGRTVGVFRAARRDGREPDADDEAEAELQARSLALALQAQEARFGEYPYPSLNIAEVPPRFHWSAASQQGVIMATSPCFDHGANLPLFAHEACHAWWGNLVSTTGPGSKICSESLAQYGAVIAIEALEGDEAVVEFLDWSREGYSRAQCASGYFEILRRGQDIALSRMDGQDGNLTHNLADSKGCWMFHMLRRRVGDELFFATLRGLITEYTGRSLSLDALRAAFVAAAPDRRLPRFFRQWLDRTGAPVITASWEPDGRITLRQATAPYDLELELELRTTAGSRRHRIVLDQAEAPLHLDLGAPLEEVRLDPDHRLLIWRPEFGDRPPVADG